MPVSLRERQGNAARLEAIEGEVQRLVEALHRRGLRSPYLRSDIVARINPVRFRKAKKGNTRPAMPMGEALTRMAARRRRSSISTRRARAR